MSLVRRGKTWWYEFTFQGVRIRESTHTRDENTAGRLERNRRCELELGMGGLKPIARPKIFKVAAKDWLDINEARWSVSNRRIEGYNVDHLLPHFGKMLLSDIIGDDVARYQAARKKEGAGPRTINMEVGTLRAILRKARLWANIQPDVRMLRTREDIGRSLSADEQHRLLVACRKSRSRSLYPAFLLSLHTGLRNAELRHLRWRNIDLLNRQLTVDVSKTKGGEGRVVPLSDIALQSLKEWKSNYPNALPGHYVFPREKYGLDGEEGYKAGAVAAYRVEPTKPIGSWKVAWTNARKEAKVACRWHDARHSFVSALAEGQASDTTIMALAGHVSKKMMERYSHTRNELKREAIAVFDRPRTIQAPGLEADDKTEFATQIPPQSESGATASLM